jgi:ABC-type transport system involved in cytochrome bd biosynthesis fused ATPase/permease subunit
VPGQLAGRTRGELMARFVGDVDTLQDLHLRVVIPALVALLVILGAATAGWLISGALGAALLLTLITIAAALAGGLRSLLTGVGLVLVLIVAIAASCVA